MNELLDKLRSPGAMMIALVLALFPQGEHTAQVFQHFSHDGSGNAQGLSYAFAAAVEVAVLLFVMAGHKRISGLFAGASFLTNVVYYAIGGVALLSVAAFPVLLLSALLPACIMGYSHTVADKTKHTDAPATPASTTATPSRAWWRWWQARDVDLLPETLQIATGLTPKRHTVNTDLTPAPALSTAAASSVNQTPPDVAHLVSMSNSEIARQLQVSRQTVSKWRADGTLAVKLADKLPELAQPHTNGANHE